MEFGAGFEGEEWEYYRMVIMQGEGQYIKWLENRTLMHSSIMLIW